MFSFCWFSIICSQIFSFSDVDECTKNNLWFLTVQRPSFKSIKIKNKHNLKTRSNRIQRKIRSKKPRNKKNKQRINKRRKNKKKKEETRKRRGFFSFYFLFVPLFCIRLNIFSYSGKSRNNFGKSFLGFTSSNSFGVLIVLFFFVMENQIEEREKRSFTKNAEYKPTTKLRE